MNSFPVKEYDCKKANKIISRVPSCVVKFNVVCF